ncbi:MAG: flavodoxin [Bacteroidales bacterium]
MKKIGVFYGTSTGNTENVAELIAKGMGATTYDVADSPIGAVAECEVLILGTSTLGIGDLQDDWDDFLPKLKDADLDGKTVALFGLGDADSYPDSFVDGMGIIYNVLKDKGCTIVGAVDTEGYDYDESIAEVDGQFVGLVIDEDNESDKTNARIDSWIELIKAQIS